MRALYCAERASGGGTLVGITHRRPRSLSYKAFPTPCGGCKAEACCTRAIARVNGEGERRRSHTLATPASVHSRPPWRLLSALNLAPRQQTELPGFPAVAVALLIFLSWTIQPDVAAAFAPESLEAKAEAQQSVLSDLWGARKRSENIVAERKAFSAETVMEVSALRTRAAALRSTSGAAALEEAARLEAQADKAEAQAAARLKALTSDMDAANRDVRNAERRLEAIQQSACRCKDGWQ